MRTPSPFFARLSRLTTVSVALALALAACGDSTLEQRGVAADAPDPDQPDVNNVNNNDDNIPDTPPPADGCCILIPAGGETHLSVPTYNPVDLGVLMFSRETGAPVSNELIEFTILDPTGGTALTERQRATNAQGLSQVGFVAGSEIREYVVRASTPEANSVEFFVAVEDAPTGDLHVTYLNAGESVYDVSPIETKVFRGSVYVCDDFRPLSQLPDADFESEVRTASGESTFQNLAVDTTWTVVALGKGEFGQLVAVGCADDLRMRTDEVLDVEVVLTLLPLNPVGRYRGVSNWDFTQALESTGNVGSTILQIFSAFENPGQFIYDQVINLVTQFVGGIIGSVVDLFLSATGLDDVIADAINGFVAGNEFLSRIQQAGLDLRDMVTRLEVISTLTVGKIGSDYQIFGTDDWLGIAVYWRWNCSPNDPPECGRYEIAIDPNTSLNLVYGEWNGRVAAYNELQIYPHTVNLHYGRLIVYLLNEFILPTLTGGEAHSLVDAILYWIGCDDLAYGITGSDGEICAVGVCIEADQIESVCNSAVRTVFGLGERLLENLEVESVLEMSGTATLVERDGDQRVDEIIDGSYDGTINIQGSRSPFTATFSATRLEADRGE